MRRERVLITGSAGVVGSALVREMSAAGYDVAAVSFRDGDLRVPGVAERIVSENQPEVILHIAARVHGLMGNIGSQGSAFLDNVQMNTNMIEAARKAGVRKFVGMGSTAVYSDSVALPMSESSIWDGPPHSSEAGYAHAKRAMIAQLEAYHQEFGLDYAVALSTNLYGPCDRFDEAKGHVLPSLISKFHRAKVEGTDVVVWGTGTPTRDFVYSADAARALRIITEEFTGVINLATGRSVTIRDAVETLCRVAEFTGEVQWDRSKPDGQHTRAYDVSKLYALGWEPSVDLAEGLTLAYQWYAEHVDRARH